LRDLKAHVRTDLKEKVVERAIALEEHVIPIYEDISTKICCVLLETRARKSVEAYCLQVDSEVDHAEERKRQGMPHQLPLAESHPRSVWIDASSIAKRRKSKIIQRMTAKTRKGPSSRVSFEKIGRCFIVDGAKERSCHVRVKLPHTLRQIITEHSGSWMGFPGREHAALDRLQDAIEVAISERNYPELARFSKGNYLNVK